jgi:acylphosphatase
MVRATHFVVSGRVQGVGFRAYVADAARAEGLDGWVKTLPDGSVEIQAEGDLEALRRFEWQVWQGPPLSRVDEVATEDVVPAGATGFRIA